MAISTYSELQDAMDNWLRRTITDARAQEMITLLESKLRRRLRVREMESTPALTVNDQEIALPSGFVGVRRLYLATDPITRLEYLPPARFWAKYVSSQTGKPLAYTIEGGNYVFGPDPDSSYTGRQLIYALTALSASNTPTLFTNHPDIYLYGALLESEAFFGVNEELHPLWRERFELAMNECIMSSAKDRAAGDVLVAHPDMVIG